MKQIPIEKCLSQPCADRRQGEKHQYCRRTFTVLRGKVILCPKGDGNNGTEI
jgi:hypothetical protein